MRPVLKRIGEVFAELRARRRMPESSVRQTPGIMSSCGRPALAVVFYDADLNLVEKEAATYELDFWNATSLEWKRLGGTADDTAPFSITPHAADWGPEEWARFPSNITAKFIPDAARAQRGQCSFAFRWINANWQERFRLFLATHRGTLDDCEKLLVWLAWSAVPQATAQSGEWKIAITQTSDDPPNPFAWAHVKRDCVLCFAGQPVELSDAQLKVLRVIVTYSMPFCKEGERHQPRVYDMWKNGGIHWRFEVPFASSHERMEARLQLRDWLQGKLSPSEVAELLG